MDKNRIHQNRKENWETPPEIFLPLQQFYNFTIDLAADATNHKVERWIGPGSAISEDLGCVTPRQLAGEVCWVNPPYGKHLKDFTYWISHLAQTCAIVALLPGSIDTGWYWDNIDPHANMICGRRGRIQFLPRGKSGNPGPSILALYNLGHLGEPPGWHVL